MRCAKERRETLRRFGQENLQVGHYLRDIGANGRMILKTNLNK